jgi:hypothetical protein
VTRFAFFCGKIAKTVAVVQRTCCSLCCDSLQEVGGVVRQMRRTSVCIMQHADVRVCICACCCHWSMYMCMSVWLLSRARSFSTLCKRHSCHMCAALLSKAVPFSLRRCCLCICKRVTQCHGVVCCVVLVV